MRDQEVRQTNVGEVNDKVDTLSKSVEENQERTKANEARIGEVDQRVAQVDTEGGRCRHSAPTRRTPRPKP